MNRYRPLQTLLAAISCFVLQPALAADAGIELRAGAIYSDNVRRTNDATEDQTIATIGLNLDLSGESHRVEGSIAGDIEFQKFLDDAFDDETIPALNADLALKFAPDVFHWVVDGSYGQLRQDPFSASTPENREDISRISTGPTMWLRFGQRTTVELQGRYALTDFEISDADSDTTSGLVSLSRELSSTRSISLTGSGDRIEYDDASGIGDYERYSAYVGFNSEISKGSLSFKLGANEIQIDGESFQSTLAGLSWNRQLTAISSVSLAFDQSYSDAGDYLSNLDPSYPPPSGTGDIVPTRDPFETKRLSASYDYAKGRVTWSLSAFAADDDYQSSSENDSRRIGGAFNIGVDFASAWSMNLGASYEDRDFQSSDRTDEYLRASFGIDRQLSRKFSLSLQYQLDDRSSSTTGEDYSENRYTLLLRFSPRRQ